MHRGVACLLWFSAALAAQVSSPPPVDAAIHAYWQALSGGRFDEAAAKREEARRLLTRLPADAPQFGYWVQNAAHLYENAGMSEQARAIAGEALARAGGLGESHPTRIMLLTTLADLWRQDRNLLKSAACLERAAAALDAAPPPASPAPAAPATAGVAYAPRRAAMRFVWGPAPVSPALEGVHVYHQLAEIYRQLGRRDAAAGVLTKLRTLAKDSPSTLASFYEREGQFDEAASLYKKEAEQAAANPQSEPSRLTAPLQALASLYQRQERYADAAAALQQAISVAEASGKPDPGHQTIWLRQNLAGIFHQAGQTGAADEIYRQLLAENPDGRNSMHLQVLTNYASYLGMTKRGTEAEDLLKQYLANHPNLQPGEESSVLYALANTARMSGATERAEEYQRAAEANQQAMMKSPPGQVTIAKDIQRAQSAANQSDGAEAFSFALQAMDAASRAIDREQIAWAVPSIAGSLAERAPDKAEQLYQRLFGVMESWSAVTLQPQLSVLQNYTRFLMQQRRWNEVPAAIQRYRNALTSARGSGTGWLEDVLGLTIESERTRNSREGVLAAARELLALQESISGTTSEPYLHAVERLAEAHQASGDSAGELPLRLRAVAIADLVTTANDARPGFTRINAAMALARQGQFDEAERLANEAVAIGQRMHPPQRNMFAAQLQEIKRMKTGETGNGRVNRWFEAVQPLEPR